LVLIFPREAALLVGIIALFKILTSKYQLYARGNIFLLPRSQAKMPRFATETTQEGRFPGAGKTCSMISTRGAKNQISCEKTSR
jgi:hypothetical protein